MESTVIETVCPFCREVHPLATTIRPDSDDSPSDGDFSICFTCGGVSIFNHNAEGRLSLPTTKEAKDIADDFDIQLALSHWRRVTGRSH